MKIVIYQLLVRLFGNRNTKNVFYGSIKENGCGKFNDINDKVLDELKSMGITHMWYTGVIEHATMTDYPAFGISVDDPDVVKGRAGSPYAIKDYYDVDPDLACSVKDRMLEFQQLIARTHNKGLKAIIDFVPNHVARTYKSDCKPKGVKDLGETDNTKVAFDINNNFYYIPGKEFIAPKDYDPGGENFHHPLKDGYFKEYPAKASGNDIFSNSPSINDWFETIKLNYGIDYSTGYRYFDPIPDTWHKMLDILLYWAGMGIDGFRCDMCEMVPTEFWEYATTEVKKQYPHIIFMGEAYVLENNRKYIAAGFDYLYDKSGLYDLLRGAINGNIGLDRLQHYLHEIVPGIEKNMVTFLENHDEQRFASPQFAGLAEKAIPLMTLCATLHTSPVMIYFGQELGATGAGATGFSGDDGRTSIFDYTYVPEMVQWANNGNYNLELLNEKQIALRNFYSNLLNLCNTEEAIISGKFGNLFESNANGKSAGFNQYKNYAFARYTDKSRLVIFVTIDEVAPDLYLKLSHEVFCGMNLSEDKEYIVETSNKYCITVKGESLISDNPNEGLKVSAEGMSAAIFKIIDN